MMMQHSVEEVNWGKSDQPTEEELRLSGGLLVEDWSHARHVTHLATQNVRPSIRSIIMGRRLCACLSVLLFSIIPV